MDSYIADAVIFGAGAVTGAALAVMVGLKIVSLAVRRIIEKMVEQGYFMHHGVRYTVKPYHLRGTRH